MNELPNGKQEEAQPFRHQLSRFRLLSNPNGRVLILALGTLLCLLIFVLTVTPKRYNLYLGMVPNQTIPASKDVVDELTTHKNRQAAADAVTPIYHYQEGVTDRVISNLEAVYAQMVAVRQYAQSLPDHGPGRVYSEEEYRSAHDLMNLVAFQDFQLATLMNTSDAAFDEMYAALNPSIRNTMQGNVTQGQESLAITSIMQVVGFKTNVNLLQNVVLPLLRSIVMPNMVEDEDATDLAREAAYNAVEPVVYKQGQNIVLAGEGRIRENHMNMLASLGLLSENAIDYAMYIGSFILVIAILALMAAFLAVFAPAIYMDSKRLSIIYLTAVLTLGLSYLSKSIDLIYMAPLILPYLLLTLTIGALPALITGIATTLISSLMLTSAGSANVDMINLLVMSIFSGCLTVLLLNKKYQRSIILLAGSLASFASFLIILAIGLMTSMTLTQTLNKALWSLAGGAIATLLCLSLQPAVESVFNLPTPMRLLDLTNPNHPLMRRLLLEAPGTYHHSIIIANLAEAASEAVGANPLLARAGAYFHDIGKLKRPLYFKENQIGTVNVHDTTDPQISAAIITAHVREGLELAKQHRLPPEIQQIIAEHHGDSLVSYFYHKALKASEEPLNEADFRYPGEKPKTAEGAIIMLCDTVEAAIRTLASPTKEEIHNFIGELIQQKLESRLLDDSPLTLKDIQRVQDACATVIYGVFHERIEYPPAPDKLPPGERLLAHIQQLRSPGKPAGKTGIYKSPILNQQPAKTLSPKPSKSFEANEDMQAPLAAPIFRANDEPEAKQGQSKDL